MAGLTDKGIAALKRKKDRYEVWDGDGLGVRVTPKGVKTFVLVYHFGGKARRLTLGRYRSAEDINSGTAADGVRFMTLTQARQAAQAAKGKVEHGIDPGAEKQTAKAQDRAAETVEDVARQYIDLYAKVNKRTWAEDERILNVYVLPKIGKDKAKAVNRTKIIELLDEIAARPAPIMANRTKAVLSKMFRWGIPRGYVDVDPTALVEKPGKERKRERALRGSEIKKFWKGVERIDYPAGVRIAIKLLLVTMQRRGEVAGIAVDEIDEANAIWTIPGARTKNGRPHAVPLSDLALALIREARQEAAKFQGCEPDDVTYLFPAFSRKGELQSLRPDKLTEAMLAEAQTIVGKDLSPHDLRRTGHTLMGAEPMSVARFIRDRIINHSDRTPGAHYDLNEYLPEKRAALKAWGDYLAQTVGAETGNVMAIAAGRR